MTFTKEYLEIELANLKQHYQEAVTSAGRFAGAVAFCEHLIKLMEQPEPDTHVTDASS